VKLKKMLSMNIGIRESGGRIINMDLVYAFMKKATSILGTGEQANGMAKGLCSLGKEIILLETGRRIKWKVKGHSSQEMG
jgi:hypothetical protein